MQETLGRAAVVCVFSFVVSGCVATPFYGQPMTERIVKDSTSFNKAYADASNSQILTNILYSRDRLPRQYAGFKDITTTQKRQLSGNLGIGSIPLGNPASSAAGSVKESRAAKLWGVGSLTGSGSAEASPSYGLSPLVGEQLTKAALSPTPDTTFIHYWNEGWPADLLLGVLVSSATQLEEKCASFEAADLLGGASDPHEYLNISRALGPFLKAEADKCDLAISAGATEPPKHYANEASTVGEGGKGENFYRFAREVKINRKDYVVRLAKLGVALPAETKLKVKAEKPGSFSAQEWAQITGGLASAKTSGLNISLPKGAAQQSSELEITLSTNDSRNKFLILEKLTTNERYLLVLRSFDQAVYYLGELLRSDCASGCSRMGGQPLVNAADDGEGSVALFTVHRRDTVFGGDPDQANTYGDETAWAAKVLYRGAWYYAGAPQGMNVDANTKGFDRTSTVLTLLGQIFELNRAPESLRLPAQLNN